MIPLPELAVGNATGRADLARRNLMKEDRGLALSIWRVQGLSICGSLSR